MKKIKIFFKCIIYICTIVSSIALIVDRLSFHDETLSAGIYRRYIKRPLDVFLSSFSLIILSPVLLLTGIFVRINLGSPILFSQERPGFKGRIFKIHKFRTMLDPQTRTGRKLTDQERLECIQKGVDILTDEERLTKFGRFLRSTSIDELPELINILIGDMSIIGPRPLATIYLPYYSKEEMRRHDIRPGLTGLAQVNGRNAAAWEKRFSYDTYYVDHCSFLLDLKILIKTVSVVFKKEGIEQGESRPEAFNTIRQQQWDEGLVIRDR